MTDTMHRQLHEHDHIVNDGLIQRLNQSQEKCNELEFKFKMLVAHYELLAMAYHTHFILDGLCNGHRTSHWKNCPSEVCQSSKAVIEKLTK